MKFEDVLNYSIGSFTVGKILSAVITFVVCYIIIKIIYKILSRILAKTTLDATLKKYVKASVKTILYFITAIVVVDSLGISATSLVAAFSVVGLAASLAVQDSLSNLASGIMLLVTKPFKSGDFVEIDEVSGTVIMISLVHTKLMTKDKKMIYVPNGKVISTKIVNYTVESKMSVEIEVSASYSAPIDVAKKSLLDAVKKVGKFSDAPQPPFAAVKAYDESSIRYVVRAWTNTEGYWDTYYALMEEIKNQFDQNGVEMTYNHLNVHMVNE